MDEPVQYDTGVMERKTASTELGYLEHRTNPKDRYQTDNLAHPMVFGDAEFWLDDRRLFGSRLP